MHLQNIKYICLIYVLKVDREKNIVQIFSYTKAEWLDIVEIEFYPGQFSGTEGKVSHLNYDIHPRLP